MTARDDLLAALDADELAQFAAGQAAQQAADAPKLAALAQQIADLNAADAIEDAALLKRIADLEAMLPPPAVADVHEVSDFAFNNSGVYLPIGNLVGNGSARTTYRLKAGTSTKRATVDALVKPQTNQMKVIRAGSGNPTGAKYGGLTIEATDQGHAYGGMVVSGTNPDVSDLVVKGIPGFSSSPPGETFALAFLRTHGHTGSRITLDGRNAPGGTSATLLGYNYVDGNTTITDLDAQWSSVGFGIALFGQASGTHKFVRGNVSNNRKAINVEGNGGCAFIFDQFTIRGTGAAYQCQVGRSTSSVQVTFIDPVVDSWPLKVAVGSGAANVQSKGDIHLILNGRDVSTDTTKLQIVGY